jgi:hypothetical protein
LLIRQAIVFFEMKTIKAENIMPHMNQASTSRGKQLALYPEDTGRREAQAKGKKQRPSYRSSGDEYRLDRMRERNVNQLIRPSFA